MKLLFDQNISYRISGKLQDLFPESKHISECGLQNSEDFDIWNYAKSDNFSIVTFDSDFFEISLINGHPPKIFWIRTGNLSTEELTELIRRNQAEINSFLSTAEEENIACLEIEF